MSDILHIVPPYSDAILAEMAQNIDPVPPQGYPAIQNRLFMNNVAVQMALEKGQGLFFVPPGHDAIHSPNRAHALHLGAIAVDQEFRTGDNAMLSDARQNSFLEQGLLLDQHGRPIHPGYKQLLQLRAADGQELGMPTGIGRFYYYGPNDVADGIVFRKSHMRNSGDEVLLIHRPGPTGGWATPGGYAEPDDTIQRVAKRTDPGVETARREVYEETGVEPEGRGNVVAEMLPISSVHTLNAWSRTLAVGFVDEDEDRLHDITPEAGDGVDDAKWHSVTQVLDGSQPLWSNDHRRYIAAAYTVRERLSR